MPPGDNPIAVKKYIISYRIIYHKIIYHVWFSTLQLHLQTNRLTLLRGDNLPLFYES